jgi:hypothetical protein
MNENDLTWLACAIDSEGMVSYPPFGQVSCGNNDVHYMRKYAQLLKELEVEFTEDSKDNGYHMHYVIRVNRKESIIKLLNFILPYLVTEKKTERSKLLLEYYSSVDFEVIRGDSSWKYSELWKKHFSARGIVWTDANQNRNNL